MNEPAAEISTPALRTKLNKSLGQALHDFSMIAEGDRLLVAVSGGKDSYVMHELLADLQRRAPVSFELLALNVDQGHPGYPREVLHDYMSAGGHAFRMIHEDTYSIVKAKLPPGKTTCSLCSRLRRGILYTAARELGCNKIALVHHRDDIVTTLLLNLFFAGQLKAMPPKLLNDAGDVGVIRPLAYCAEQTIAAYAQRRAYPIIPCVLCGSQANLQRQRLDQMLIDIERDFPHVRATMLSALRNVRPSHLLDTDLWSQLGMHRPSSATTPPLRHQQGNHEQAPEASSGVTQSQALADDELIRLRVPKARANGQR